MLNTKFYTHTLGAPAWRILTKGMPPKVRQQLVTENITSCLTYLQECSKRFEELRPGTPTTHVPKFFQQYVKTSNLINIVHYLTKYTEHADRVEKGLLSRLHAEEDEEDSLMFTGAQLRNSEKLAGRLLQRKISPHKRHLTDDQLDDYAVSQLCRIIDAYETPPNNAKEYLKYIADDPHANPWLKLKAVDNRFASETFVLEYGMPEFINQKSLEEFFQEDPPRLLLRDGNHVSTPFKDSLKQLTDPFYLPSRQDLYPVWPWLDPLWRPHYGPQGGPPPQFYPATWYYYMENACNPVVELWTKEYINSLTDYIVRRAGEIPNSGKKFKVVEIGARDGRLSHFLRKRLEELGETNIEVHATDIDHVLNNWNESLLPVVPAANPLDAIAKYDPQLVICTWMPTNKDFTANFREYKTVHEYILIGPANGSIAGHLWETWGLPYNHGDIPLYIRAGWQRYDLKYLSLFQVAQNFGPYFQFGSKTIAFRRMPREWRPDRSSEGSRKYLKAQQEKEFNVMKRMSDENKAKEEQMKAIKEAKAAAPDSKKPDST